MVKQNYRPWYINPEDFSANWNALKKLQFFVKYAVLAPSGHNTQPWRFGHEGQTLRLEFDSSRHLAYSGSLAAEPHVSLGACLEVLRLAALGFGYELKIKYVMQAELIATIQLGAPTQADPSLLSAICHRASNRSFYKDEPLAKTAIDQLLTNELKEASLLAVTDKATIRYLAEETKIATEVIMSDPQFRAELSVWVRNNHTKQVDGMPGFVQGMPTPPSMIAKHVIKHLDISKGQAKKDSARVLNSPAVILVSAHQFSPQAFMEVGRLYARVCVLAQQAGLATNGVGAATIDPEAKLRIKNKLHLDYLPTALIRLGHATKPARHTPRRDPAKLTH